jgi:uncharacterized protein
MVRILILASAVIFKQSHAELEYTFVDVHISVKSIKTYFRTFSLLAMEARA